ncbi:MAG: HIT family protein [Pseudomonadales bacterium]|nr:HIT family protein [Pseudomonadales bacterium]
MSAPFELHPRLAADCIVVGDLPLSCVLLMNDSRFAWCILVPRHADLRELHDLAPGDGHLLFDEIERVSRALLATRGADKLNVGALGNLVPQLHIHVVARRIGDDAWPGPVWGSGPARPYPEQVGLELATRLAEALGAPAAPGMG